MPLSTDINLPKNHVPRFPDECVLCRCASPDSSVRMVTGSIGWWSWLLWTFGKPHILQAPACRRCKWLIHLQRFFSLFVMLFFVWIAFWVIWPHFEDHVSKGLRKFAMMGLGVLCVAPQVIFEMFHPRQFDITAFADSVDYEFRDLGAAIEFANANHDAEWINIDGVEFGIR
jgi:hypothetical protein